MFALFANNDILDFLFFWFASIPYSFDLFSLSYYSRRNPSKMVNKGEFITMAPALTQGLPVSLSMYITNPSVYPAFQTAGVTSHQFLLATES